MAHQKIYFSTIKYGDLIPVNSKHTYSSDEIFKDNFSILLVSGIANTTPLEQYLKRKAYKLNSITFPDHHDFTEKDIKKISKEFDEIISSKKIIITTEKDVMRLRLPRIETLIKKLPIYYIPIEIEFNEEDKASFDSSILNHISEFNA